MSTQGAQHLFARSRFDLFGFTTRALKRHLTEHFDMLLRAAIVALFTCFVLSDQCVAFPDEDVDEVIRLEHQLLDLIQAKNYVDAVPLAERIAALRAEAQSATDRDRVTANANLWRILQHAAEQHHAANKFDEERASLERAVEVLQSSKTGSDLDLAVLLTTLGDVLQVLGDFGRAREHYDQALHLISDTQNYELPVLFIRLRSALLAARQADYLSARMELNDLIPKIRPYSSTNSEVQKTMPLLWLVSAALSIVGGDTETAERQIAQVAALGSSENSIPRGRELFLSMEALLSAAKRDWDKTDKNLREVLKLRDPHDPEVGMTLVNIAMLESAHGQFDQARNHLDSAIAILTSSLPPEHPYLAEALLQKAVFYCRNGEMDMAVPMLLRGARLLELHVSQVLSGWSFAEQRGCFLDSTLPNATSFLFSCSTAAKDIEPEYDFVARWKGLLVETLRRQAALSRIASTPSHRELIENLERVRSELSALLHSPRSLASTEMREQLATASREKEALERDITRLPASADISDPISAGTAAVRGVLANDEALADIHLYVRLQTGEHRYAAVLVTLNHGPTVVDLCSFTEAQQAIRSWREDVLRNRPSEISGARLGQLLWQPLSASMPVGASRVWVSPDGELARVPWHLLPDLVRSNKTIEITQIDSPRELVMLRSSQRLVRNPLILLAGGIDFNGAVTSRKSTVARFGELPGTATEISQIVALAKEQGFVTVVLTGRVATVDALLAAMPGTQYVHLATHGFFAREPAQPEDLLLTRLVISLNLVGQRNPLAESGLVFAGVNTQTGSHRIGVLTAEQLVTADLHNAELVVLSACDTGRGEETTGQGVLGLRSALVAAGAHSVLMSLWRVPDEPTALLMKDFYTNLWQRRLSKTHALRRAQQMVSRDPRFREPLNWAGWVLVGEGW